MLVQRDLELLILRLSLLFTGIKGLQHESSAENKTARVVNRKQYICTTLWSIGEWNENPRLPKFCWVSDNLKN